MPKIIKILAGRGVARGKLNHLKRRAAPDAAPPFSLASTPKAVPPAPMAHLSQGVAPGAAHSRTWDTNLLATDSETCLLLPSFRLS